MRSEEGEDERYIGNSENVEKMYSDMIEYKKNMFMIDTLLKTEAGDKEKEEYMKYKNSLKQAIQHQEDMIKLQHANGEFFFNTDHLQVHIVGRVCQGWHPRDKRWYNAKIATVDVDKQEAKVAWIGYPEVDRLKAMYVRLLPVPDQNKLIAGTLCEAICPDDGKWQGVVIEKVTDQGYAVKFRKSGTKHVNHNSNFQMVSLYFLREARHSSSNKKQAELTSMLDFKVPDHLKIMPNDSVEERDRKKKKLKHMKQSHRTQLMDREMQERRSKWNDFNDKTKRGGVKESIFKTPDNVLGRVGYMNSGKGMTAYNSKDKYDNLKKNL